MPLIVIEGPDGAGKSTLIESLRENSTRYFAILRASGPPKNLSGQPTIGYEFMQAVLRFASNFPHPVVCDRFHIISENIYGHVLRGRTRESIEQMVNYLDGVDFLIYCRPAVLMTGNQEQMAGVNEKLGEIVAAYDELMQGLSYRRGVFLYDYTQPNSIDRVRDLIFGKQT